jgi:hypothetical protein
LGEPLCPPTIGSERDPGQIARAKLVDHFSGNFSRAVGYRPICRRHGIVEHKYDQTMVAGLVVALNIRWHVASPCCSSKWRAGKDDFGKRHYGLRLPVLRNSEVRGRQPSNGLTVAAKNGYINPYNRGVCRKSGRGLLTSDPEGRPSRDGNC